MPDRKEEPKPVTPPINYTLGDPCRGLSIAERQMLEAIYRAEQKRK